MQEPHRVWGTRPTGVAVKKGIVDEVEVGTRWPRLIACLPLVEEELLPLSEAQSSILITHPQEHLVFLACMHRLARLDFEHDKLIRLARTIDAGNQPRLGRHGGMQKSMFA